MFNDLYLPDQRVLHDMLPEDVRWHYVQAPPDLAHQMAGCPTSAHPHGVIGTSRRLGHHEMNAAKLMPFKPGKHWPVRAKPLLQLSGPEEERVVRLPAP